MLPTEKMIETQLKPRGINDPLVLEAMARVQRDRFVPGSLQKYAYSDCPLPIEDGQTISQPYIVAAMTQALQLKPEHHVLEIGTGSGYQTAVLAEIVSTVHTVEIIETLGVPTRKKLIGLGYNNIDFHIGDGRLGRPEAAPFDGIMVTAAPETIPPALIAQLKPGGRMIIPVGPIATFQSLALVTKDLMGSVQVEDLMSVRFVPLTGEG